MHETTIEELRNELEKGERAFQYAWQKAGNSDYAKYRSATSEEVSRIAEYYNSLKRNASAAAKPDFAEIEERVAAIREEWEIWRRQHGRAIETVAAPTQPKWRKWILYGLMAVPAAASVQNIYAATFDLSNDRPTAILLTALFSGAPFGFVLSGMRSRFAQALTIALITYECFSNFTRIYGWLTDFGHTGYPTRFLALITTVFNSGTHYTAIVMAAAMSMLAAGVFYAAYFEINNSKSTK